MTATPCRTDGRGLGNTFETMIQCPQVEELIELGYLVGTKVFAPSTPDLQGVHTRQGDYVQEELARRVDRAELVGDIVSHWHRLADRRKTVVFATNVSHSIHLKDEFIRSGVKAEHIDGSTPKDERDEILARLSAGDLELVSNCMVLTEGWDQPDVSCIVLARPTKSMGLFRQMVGRGLRPYEGKDHCLVLDHAGATYHHGFVQDPVIWTLDEDERAESPEQISRSSSSERKLLSCEKCAAVRTAGKPCSNCGHMPKRRGEHLDVIDGDLAHLDRNGRLHPHQWTPAMKADFQQQLVGIAMQRGYKLGWAAHKFKEKFGHWPRISNVPPKVPTPETLAWERSRRIAWAKARASANA
jgi:DNA repair protein RadD